VVDKSPSNEINPVRRRRRVAFCKSSPCNHFSANSLLAFQEAVQFDPCCPLR